jgi:small-conductance mechanosensitive channel
MNIFAILQSLLLQFASVIPKVIGAIMVSIIGWIISRLLSKLVLAGLRGIGIDKLTDQINEVDMVQKMNIKIELSSVIANIIYYFLMLIFFVAATDVLGMPVVSNLISDLIAYIPQAISACILLFVGLLAAEAIKSIVLKMLLSLNVPSAKMIANFVFYFVLISVSMGALEQAKVNIGFITTNLSIILAGGVLAFALAYGFASRQIVSNLLTSMYQKDRYRIGMEISVDGIRGTIIEMDSSSLVLRTNESKVVMPLSRLAATHVEIHDQQLLN